MKGFFLAVGVLICLAVFGLPILWCFMGLLCVILGIGVEVALPVGIILTVIWVTGIGIKTFFIDED